MSKTYTFNEASKELGYASYSGLSVMLRRANIHVKRDRVLPTNGHGFRTITAEQLQAIKDMGYQKGKAMTVGQQRKLRQIIYGTNKVESGTADVQPVLDIPVSPLQKASNILVQVDRESAELRLKEHLGAEEQRAKNRATIHGCALLLARTGYMEEAAELLKVGERI